MPSSRVRVLNLLDKLQAKGYEITCIKYPKRINDKMLLFKTIGHFDIVYLQKKLPSPVESYILAKLSKKLIFDFDDAIYMKHERYKKQSAFGTRVKFKQIIKSCDAVVTGNSILADHIKNINKNIHIIPSVLETDNMPQKDYNSKSDKFIVGWVGGNVNLTQLEMLNEVFDKLAETIPIQVNVISGEAPQLNSKYMNFIKWDINIQDTEIAKFDVGVMPLPDSPYARGKCAYKVIQYMACGVVPVVSDVGINSEVVQDGSSGLVAKNFNDFYDKIIFLFENKDKAKILGENASKRAHDKFSIESAVNQLDQLFKTI